MSSNDALDAIADRIIADSFKGCCGDEATLGRLCDSHAAFADAVGRFTSALATASKPDLIAYLTEHAPFRSWAWEKYRLSDLRRWALDIAAQNDGSGPAGGPQ